MPPFIVVPPENLARLKVLYEQTGTPVRDLARMAGMGISTFMRRTRVWGWHPRNRSLAEHDAAAKAGVPVEEIRKMAEGPMAVIERAALIERVRAAVEREIVAIENVLTTVEAVRLRSPDIERAARTLSTLVRTLREVATLEKAGVEDTSEKEDQFRDLDEFRRELVARLDRMRGAGSAD